jgi:hypothetical protein
MRKWLIVAGVGFVALLVIVGAWFVYDALSTRPNIRLAIENFPKIKDGMTQPEVEALLGGPPGNFGRHSGGGMMTMEGYSAPHGGTELIWCDDANRFEIYFDQGNRVVGMHRRAGYSQEPPEGFFTWLKGLLQR